MLAAATGADHGTPSAPALYRKLLLLTGLRLMVGTALLGATAWLTLAGGESFGRRVDVLLYAIVGSIYFASLVAVAFLRSGRHLRAVAYLQIAGDVVAATGLVYLTGGAESFFTILYPLAIVNAAISLSRRGAMVAAAASAAAFSLLAVLMEAGMLAPPAALLERPPLDSARLLLTVFAHVSAFFLTAALASYLADALQGARTQLAQRETQLASLSELHQSIVRSLSSGLLTVDGSLRVSFVNPAGEEILGLRQETVMGHSLADRFPELAEALHRSSPGRGEARVRRGDGGERILGHSVAPLVDAGAPSRPGYVIVFQDLTPFRQLEEAMRRSDRLAAVGKLAAGLAHEIRNPLASMCGSIELLGSAPGLNAKDRRLMQIVLREGERLEALVRDFLSFARPTPPQLGRVDVGRLLEETLAVAGPEAKARGLTLSAETAPGLLVRADGDQLKQVVWNLIRNAREACDSGGALRVRLLRDGDCVVLEVEDSGAGIAAEDLARIFDPFFTTKERGTGLGLAIVHRIVEAHGGRITVKSVPGQGSVFRIELPAAAAGDGPRALAPAALPSATA
jgi:two-component system sensor histidine kinase PilS (NtrC family)